MYAYLKAAYLPDRWITTCRSSTAVYQPDSCISTWQLHIHLTAVNILTDLYQPDSCIYPWKLYISWKLHINLTATYILYLTAVVASIPPLHPEKVQGWANPHPVLLRAEKIKFLKLSSRLFILAYSHAKVKKKRSPPIEFSVPDRSFSILKKSDLCRLTIILLCSLMWHSETPIPTPTTLKLSCLSPAESQILIT